MASKPGQDTPPEDSAGRFEHGSETFKAKKIMKT